MDDSKNRHNDNLGVNKIGKNIRKSPLHQPNSGNNATSGRQQQPQPQVYNISKNDFRDIVQQLTGSPSHNHHPPPRPPHNSPKPQSMRLQKIRPPPLTPINRPPMPVPAAAPPAPYYNSTLPRPAQFGQPSPNPLRPLTPGDMAWANTAESPISAYMRYLQNSMMDPGSRGNQVQPHLLQPQVQGNAQPHPPASALLPNPPVPMLPSPRLNGPIPPVNATIPSPTSQFLLPSSAGYMNFLSPRSPYPLLSPGVQFPSPFSPFAQSGILGPGPQPPLSPGLFPFSPSGFFPIASPRWRDL